MIDTVQIVLLFVIVILTALLIVLGIQVFHILKEFRKTIYKANKILDNTGEITESVSEPLSFLSTLILGTKSISSISKILQLRKKTKE